MEKNNLIFSYTTKQALADGFLVDTETIDKDLSQNAGIKYPVYLTSAVFERYIKFDDSINYPQDTTGRLWDILFMFAFCASNQKSSTMLFDLYVAIPPEDPFLYNEKPCAGNSNVREVTLRAIITAKDIDDPSPAIYILLPSED